MRTVTLFGLIVIADSIGKGTGWVIEPLVAQMGALIFVYAIVLDIVKP